MDCSSWKENSFFFFFVKKSIKDLSATLIF